MNGMYTKHGRGCKNWTVDFSRVKMNVEAKPLHSTVVQPAALKYGPAERKLSRTKDPERWMLMSRLIPPAKSCTPRTVIRGDWDTSSKEDAHVIPKKDGYSCACHQKSLHVTRSVWRSGKIQNVKRFVPKSDYGFVRKIREDMKENASEQFPLSTIVVSWRPDMVLYNLQSLHKLLSVFGTIVQMQYVSCCSVVVVFNDLSHSCRLISIRNMVARVNQIYCTWFHKCMENKHFNVLGGLRVYQNVYLHY